MDALRYPVTLIVAPAGSGKSVLLQHFAANDQRRCIRYNVAAGEATLFAVARGLAEALGVSQGTLRALARSSSGAATKELAEDLARWVNTHLRSFAGVIIIDDWHATRNEPTASVFLSSLISRSVDNHEIRWVIATRDPLALTVASWIAYEHATLPIDENDLRFTPEEAALTALEQGANVESEELAALLDLTSGWAVAMAFALRTATRSRDLNAVGSQTRDMMYGYLAEQVMRSLPSESREFLLRTCVFPTLALSALIAAGFDNATAMIEELKDQGAFLQTDGAGRYRYHDLFREYLEHELELLGATALRSALEAAADALAVTGNPGEALVRYVRARHVTKTLNIVTRFGFSLVEEGRFEALRSAIDLLSHSHAEQPSVLALQATFEANEGHISRATALYRRAMTLQTDRNAKARVALALARAVIDGGEKEAIDTLQPFIDVELEPGLHAEIIGAFATALINIGLEEDAKQQMSRALELSHHSKDPEVRIRVRLQSAVIALHTGDFATAEREASVCIAEGEALGFHRLVSSGYTLLNSINHDVFDDRKKCSRFLRLSIDNAAKGGWRQQEFARIAELIFVEAERGDEQEIAALEQSLEGFPGYGMTRGNTLSLLPARAIQAAWAGDIELAWQMLHGTVDELLSPDARAHAARRGLRWSMIAMFAAGAGKRDEALQAIAECLAECRQPSAQEQRSIARAFRATCFCVVALIELDMLDKAREVLRPLFTRRREMPGRSRALFDVVNAQLVYAQTGAAYDDVEIAFATMESHDFGGMVRVFRALPIGLHPVSSSLAKLTTAELAVLKELARGASSRAIASRTGRSPQTVDAHVKAIVRKLACKGRGEAVDIARRHGLVS